MSVNGEISHDTKTIIAVLLLIFLNPVGLIVMWFWTKWKLWVKILISLPAVFLFFLFLLSIVLVAIYPSVRN